MNYIALPFSILDWRKDMNGLIQFKSDFLDFYERQNSKTYYHLLISAKLDIPLLVHSYEYAKRLIFECRELYAVKNPPIFCILTEDDYARQLSGSLYRRKKFIVDDPIVFQTCRRPLNSVLRHNILQIYEPSEVRDIVLTYLSTGGL